MMVTSNDILEGLKTTSKIKKSINVFQVVIWIVLKGYGIFLDGTGVGHTRW